MVVHGGVDTAELQALQLQAEDVLDFSVNSNPYGPCPRVLEAIRNADLTAYPDIRALAARQSMARALSVDVSTVGLGAGAAELLWGLARVILKPGDRSLVVMPTFGEFAAAVHHVRATVLTCWAHADNHSAIDLPMIDRLLSESDVRCVYLCSPNTPTGVSVELDALTHLANSHPRVTFILDQSFLSLSTHHDDISTPLPANVVCVRSLTKDHALCGVRVGYIVAAPEIVDAMERVRPAWSTSAIAQAAARVALWEQEFVETSRTRLLHDTQVLRQGMAGLGLSPFPSTVPFFLVPVPQAARLRAALLVKHQVLVRDCTSFGLPGAIRIATRRPEENARLLQALHEVL